MARAKKLKQFNYLKYVTPWAVKILAGVSGYSLSKAYAIDYKFGKMVERLIDAYKQEIEMAQELSTRFGVHMSMANEYTNFYNELKEDVEFFDNHRLDWFAEVNVRTWDEGREMFRSLDYEDPDAYMRIVRESYEEDLESVVMNKIITRKTNALIGKTVELAQANYVKLVPEVASAFKDLNKIAQSTLSYIDKTNEDAIYSVAILTKHLDEYGPDEQSEDLMNKLDELSNALHKIYTQLVEVYTSGLNNIKTYMRRFHLDD